jgi:hypothetical protein
MSALLLLSWPVTALLLTEVAGQSRATAMGMFMGGLAGGLVLSLGYFPRVGVFCTVTAIMAAVIVQY